MRATLGDSRSDPGICMTTRRSVQVIPSVVDATRTVSCATDTPSDCKLDASVTYIALGPDAPIEGVPRTPTMQPGFGVTALHPSATGTNGGARFHCAPLFTENA